MVRVANGWLAALTLAVVAGEAEAQAGIYEIRCRGGEGLFAIDGPAVTGSDTLHLNFLPSARPAGANGAGLEAGTCAWIDRAFRDGEPAQIYFTASGPADAAAHLNDSTHYWSFWVYNTNRGYFESQRNQAWTPPPPFQTERPGEVIASPSTPEVKPAPRQGEVVTQPAKPRDPIQRPVDPVVKRNLPVKERPRDQQQVVFNLGAPTVTPIFRGANIAFKGRRDAAPTVTFGTGAAVKGSDGVYRLPREIATLNALQLSKSTGPVADYLVSYSQLEQGQTYSYLINLPALIPEGHTAALPHQKRGTFKALGRRVRVVFSHITVQSDSDEDGAGELDFTFFGNGYRHAEVGTILQPVSWESGTRRKVDATMVIENAPDGLRLIVQCFDNDHRLFDSGKLRPDLEWETLTPGFNEAHEWNYAKAEFDVSRMPSNGETVPFTMRSLPSNNPRLSLAFDVSGYIEVIQP